jgi:hypothetical protein
MLLKVPNTHTQSTDCKIQKPSSTIQMLKDWLKLERKKKQQQQHSIQTYSHSGMQMPKVKQTWKQLAALVIPGRRFHMKRV